MSKVSKQTNQESKLVSYAKELSTMTTKSEKIRYLNSKGYTRGQIAKELGIIYQHVRNVLEMPVKNPKATAK